MTTSSDSNDNWTEGDKVDVMKGSLIRNCVRATEPFVSYALNLNRHALI